MKLTKHKAIALITGCTLGLALALVGTSIIARESKQSINQLPLDDVQRFSTAISQIKRYYVKSVKDEQLFEDAIRGMLTGLDPHSSYLDEGDFKDLTQTTKGEFGGLGIEVTMENGLIKVISPIDGTPAQKAGIKAGDLIIRLDKKPVKDMTLRDAVNIMRGKRGSKITLTISRKNENKPLTITIVRDIIQIQSVKSRLLDKHYAYIRVSHFQAKSAEKLKAAMKKLQQDAKGQIRGLILDLRNNPGGLLDSAIEMSDAFIHNDQKGDEELIVYTKGRLPGAEFTATATPGDIIKQAPIVVLINEGSASGSEIVAGALKDNNRAVIIGTKSFGKGSVQTVLPLGKNRGIKLTTALYYTPSGRSIQAKGITPDIVVENIKIPQQKEDKNAVRVLQEADLQGHLANGNATKEKDSPAKPVKKESKTQNLMHEDYQLFQALTLLKGLALMQQSDTRRFANHIANKTKAANKKR